MEANIVDMRKDIDVLKMKVAAMQKAMEDFEFIEGTKEAYKDIDEGRSNKMSGEEFLEEIEKW